MTDRMTEEKAKDILNQFKDAQYIFDNVHPNAKAYFLAEGHIQGRSDERKRAEGLVKSVEAFKKLLVANPKLELPVQLVLPIMDLLDVLSQYRNTKGEVGK